MLGVDDLSYAADAGTPPIPDSTIDAPILSDAASDADVLVDAGPLPPDGPSTYIVQHLTAPPTQLATDGFWLFWASGPQISRSKGAPDASTTFVDASGAVLDLVATGTYVAWSTGSALEASPTAGGSVVGEVSGRRIFTAVGDLAYFVAGSGGGTQINDCSMAAPCGDAGALFAAPYLGMHDLVADKAAVFFLGAYDAGGQAVFSCPLSAGCPAGSASFRPGLGSPTALSFDVASLFWVDVGSIKTLPRSLAGMPSIIASGERSPQAVVSDGTYVYWTSADGIRTSEMDGGSVRTLVPAEGGTPTELVVFGPWLVWLDPANENVVAAARPK